MKKRIISIILSCLIVASSVLSASASNLDEIRDKVTKAEESASDTDTNAETTEKDFHINQSFNGPTGYMYQLFNDIIDLYVEQHLYEFTREELLEKLIYDMIQKQPSHYKFMINTLLGTMDKYSAYHDIDSGYMTESETTGYGIVVKDTGDAVVINKVVKNSNAEAAGIMAGDKIVSVMGYDTSRLPWKAVSLLLTEPYVYTSIRNEEGDYDNYNPEIELVVDRNGEHISFKLTKGQVVQNELNLEYYEEEQVAYIQITSFVSETLDKEFEELLKQVKEKGYKNLILDLRDNGGGSLDLVMSMAENFVDDGEIMCYFNNKTLEKPEPVISDTPNIGFEKISILINRNTASAAELMASILRNKSGAVLVGETSFGKAIGQTVYTLTAGGYITITTYEILDANGESYNDIGLVPELKIDNVEMLYVLPELKVFNHVNYKDIEQGVYSDACLALEQRLEVMGLLRNASVDGIWDSDTNLAIILLQRSSLHESFYTDGTLNDRTVSLITDLINSYKDYTYNEDSQFDTALIYHSSLSQAKRLIAEKEKLAKQQKQLIKENQEKLRG